MNTFEVHFPRVITIGFSKRTIELCEAAVGSPGEEVLFDLSDVEFIAPFGITTLAGYVRNCQGEGKKVAYRRPENETARKYLSNIGFHHYFGLNQEHRSSKITRVDLKQISGVDSLHTEGLLEVLDHHMNLSPGMKYSINFSLTELMTNFFDHSQSPIGAFLCAQFTPTSQLIRICIADFGRGILNALRSVPKYSNIWDSSSAIRKAVEKGVSSRTTRTKGIGLPTIRSFLRLNQGIFSIISGDSKVNFYYNKIIEKKWMPYLLGQSST